MVSSVQSKHTSEKHEIKGLHIQSNKAQRYIQPVIHPQTDLINDTRQRLTQTLQMSLDVKDILKSFFHHSRELINFNALEYHHETDDFNLVLGKKSVHSCNYRLHTQEGNLGEIIFSSKKRFLESDMAQIESLIGLLIYPLRNALRYREALQTALTDALTGTGNRVALDNALRREAQLVNRYDQDTSLLMLDIDYFKKINDSYGHRIGDAVLKEVAAIIQSVSRTTDMTFRYGGEEFVVILSKTDCQGAAIIAERIRQFIARLLVPAGVQNVKTTISIGISTLQKGDSITELLEQADQALYRAKDLGRNQVVCASKFSN